MTPGPVSVYKCPQCDSFLTNCSLASGNTFGIKIYSDGKHLAPMLPEFPKLTICKSCQTIFWLSKIKEIGSFEFGENTPLEWQNAKNASFLTIYQYFSALKLKIAENKNEERWIRIQIWNAFNDRLRNGGKIFMNVNDEGLWQENCNELIGLLDPNDLNQKIMLAELHRNLGYFEECIKLMVSIDAKEMEWIKAKFLTQCENKNKWLIQLNK